jgi:hypothetical protein
MWSVKRPAIGAKQVVARAAFEAATLLYLPMIILDRNSRAGFHNCMVKAALGNLNRARGCARPSA